MGRSVPATRVREVLTVAGQLLEEDHRVVRSAAPCELIERGQLDEQGLVVARSDPCGAREPLVAGREREDCFDSDHRRCVEQTRPEPRRTACGASAGADRQPAHLRIGIVHCPVEHGVVRRFGGDQALQR